MRRHGDRLLKPPRPNTHRTDYSFGTPTQTLAPRELKFQRTITRSLNPS